MKYKSKRESFFNLSCCPNTQLLVYLDGESIHVWNFPWIPSMPGFKRRPNVNLVGFPDFCVADLTLPSVWSWNVDLLHDLFEPFTVQSILSIHIPQIRAADQWTWAPAASGLFFCEVCS
jgi:hypothetical protein